MKTISKERAPRNRTLVLSNQDKTRLKENLCSIKKPVVLDEITEKTIHQDIFEVIDYFPDHCVDLLIADPPYNLTKTFNGSTFRASEDEEYIQWTENWVAKLPRLLKPNASIYVCCDWRCSNAIYMVLSRYFQVRNRITWEREKGRGAKANWKNSHEDIWFATVSSDYTFNLDDVKVKRKVLAPYRVEGAPKDWTEEEAGNYRLTHPSNLWTDLTVPFWSMPENTDHPTQKPEKLIAKLILASSNENDVVFDPFLGSGTTSVVAKKLNRRFFGVELDETYCLFAEKRLENVNFDASIQGYTNGVFWERNTLADQERPQMTSQRIDKKITKKTCSLFALAEEM